MMWQPPRIVGRVTLDSVGAARYNVSYANVLICQAEWKASIFSKKNKLVVIKFVVKPTSVVEGTIRAHMRVLNEKLARLQEIETIDTNKHLLGVLSHAKLGNTQEK